MACNFLSLPVMHWRNRNLAPNHRYNTIKWHILNKGNSTPMDSLKYTLFLCPSNKFGFRILSRDITSYFHSAFVMHNLILCKDMSKIWPKAFHDDALTRKRFTHYWAFMRGIHRSPVNVTVLFVMIQVMYNICSRFYQSGYVSFRLGTRAVWRFLLWVRHIRCPLERSVTWTSRG